ncbi:hypothetical protein PtB15_15B414 [Puccinia triticina]|nr:hypothetical protein PtB15_15B414 [Puccinia triticina]
MNNDPNVPHAQPHHDSDIEELSPPSYHEAIRDPHRRARTRPPRRSRLRLFACLLVLQLPPECAPLLPRPTPLGLSSPLVVPHRPPHQSGSRSYGYELSVETAATAPASPVYRPAAPSSFNPAPDNTGPSSSAARLDCSGSPSDPAAPPHASFGASPEAAAVNPPPANDPAIPVPR